MQSENAVAGLLRLGLVVAGGVAVGTALGWQDYWRSAQGTLENFRVMQAIDSVERDSWGESPSATASEPKTYPVLEVVGGETHNFGVTKPGVKLEHTFIVRNLGTGPLELRLQDTTCKCVTMELDKDKPTIVLPGEEFPVMLEFRSEKPSDSFVQQARIKTNDPHPSRNILKLKVEGRVVSRINVRPEVVDVPEMMSSVASKFGFNIYTFKLDDVAPDSVTVSSVTCDNPLLAERIEFTWEPLSEDEVKAEYQAYGGYRVTGTIPAGMPMNNYSSNILVTTSDGSEASLGVNLSVKAPVSIREISVQKSGIRFFEESKFVEFGLVPADQSAEIELMAVYRTDKKGDLDVQVAEIFPEDALEAEIVEVRRTASAALVRLRIAVRKDSAPVQLNGPKRNSMGRVIVRTDSEEAQEINFAVSFSKL
jgi:hypothetical protein